MCFPVDFVKLRISILWKSYERLLLIWTSKFFFFVLILRQNRYLPLNSDHLLGKQRTMLRYRSQPSKISYLRFGDVFYLFTCWISIPTRLRWYHRDWVCIIEKTDVSTRETFNFIQMKKSQLWKSLLFPALCFYIYGLKKYVSDF